MLKNSFLFIAFALSTVLPLTGQTTIAESPEFTSTDSTNWPYAITLARLSDGESSRAAQSLAINITSLPEGAQYRVVKSQLNTFTEGHAQEGNFYQAPPLALSLGSKTLTTGNAVAFDRKVSIQFSSGDIVYDGLVINPNFATKTIGVDDFVGLNTGDANNLAIDVSSNGFNLKLGPGTSSLGRDAFGVGTLTFGQSGAWFDGSYAKFGNTNNQQQLDLRISNNTGSDVKLKNISFDLRRDPANANYATDFQLLYLNAGDSALIKGSSVALGSEMNNLVGIGSGNITTGINNFSENIGGNISGTAWIADGGYANIRLKLNTTAPTAATQLDNLDVSLEVVDYSAPVITLNGQSTLSLIQGDVFTDLGSTVTDNSGEIIDVVVSGDTVDTSVRGTYNIVYTATDSTGNTSSTTRTVSVLDPIEWSEDFTSPVNILDGLGGLSGDTHAYTWSKAGNGLTATPIPSTVAQVGEQVVLAVNSEGSDGAARLHMVGPGTDNGRRVAPVFHETTFEIDFISFKGGQADLTLRTRGYDGWVQSKIAPSGAIQYSTWMSNYTHTNFDNFSGPSSLRNNTNNPGIVIVDGGTFDPASADPVTVTISGNAEGTVVMNAEGTAVESVTLTDYGSGYTADPTVTFAGGGMTVAPTVSFNYETGNITNNDVVQVALGDTDGDGNTDNWNLFENGQTLTYIQSYNPVEDSISYYFSLDGAEPTFIIKLTAADHSAGGHGFFDFTTGNRWVQPRNQDAVYIQYQRWGSDGITGRVGINSVSVAISDDDGDGVINRNDVFPNDATETVDSDSDGVGDNSDAHPGYDDTELTPYIDQWLTDNNYIVDDGTSGGISQEDYDAVVAERDARPTQAAYDAVVAEIDAIPTAAEVQSSFLDDRDGSVGVSVSDGEASISLEVEQSDDLEIWTSGSTTTLQVPVSGDATFLRVRAK